MLTKSYRHRQSDTYCRRFGTGFDGSIRTVLSLKSISSAGLLPHQISLRCEGKPELGFLLFIVLVVI